MKFRDLWVVFNPIDARFVEHPDERTMNCRLVVYYGLNRSACSSMFFTHALISVPVFGGKRPEAGLGRGQGVGRLR